ncbi:DUF1620 superfamily [Balamuthia mandrillaris]
MPRKRSVAWILLFIVVGLLAQVSRGLYADQAGKLDWTKENIGKVSSLEFHEDKRAFVATESGAIASLNLDTGATKWRRILPNEERAHLLRRDNKALLTLSAHGKHVSLWSASDGSLLWTDSTFSFAQVSEDLLSQLASESETSVQQRLDAQFVHDLDHDGQRDILLLVLDQVQARSGKDGRVIWTWSSSPNNISGRTLYRLLVVPSSTSSAQLYVIGFEKSGGNAFVVVLDPHNGKVLQKERTLRLLDAASSSALTAENCVVTSAGPYLACLADSLVYVLPLKTESSFTSIPLTSFLSSTSKISEQAQLRSISDTDPALLLHSSKEHSALLRISDSGGRLSIQVIKEFTSVEPIAFSASSHISGKSFVAAVTVAEQKSTVSVVDLQSGQIVLTESYVALNAGEHGAAEKAFLSSVTEKGSSNSDVRHKIVVVTQDHALTLLDKMEGTWTREEALASITHTQVIGLPAEVAVRHALQKEFGTDEGVVGNFVRRIKSHGQELLESTQRLIATLSSSSVDKVHTSVEEASSAAALTQDKFGLNRLIVVATSAGKVFALRTTDGTILWQRFIRATNDHLYLFRPTALYVRRSSAHPPPQAVLIGRPSAASAFARPEEDAVATAIVLTLNLLTGEEEQQEQQQRMELNQVVDQSILLPAVDPLSFAHPVLLMLDGGKSVTYYPNSPATRELIQAHHSSVSFYLVKTTSRDDGHDKIEGYGLTKDLRVVPTWNVEFPSSQERIQTIASPQPGEHVASPVVVQGENNVIRPRYINSNMFVVVTYLPTIYDSANAKTTFDSTINVYLIDAVSGRVLYDTYYKNAQPPVATLQSENWVVLQYWNWKNHRYEMTVLELFEPSPIQWQSYRSTSALSQSFVSLFLSSSSHDYLHSSSFSEEKKGKYSAFDMPPPVVEQQSYAFPSGVKRMAVTQTTRGITNKYIILGLSSDRLLTLDKRFLNYRRKMKEDITAEEKSDGVIPYSPNLPYRTVDIINYNHTVYNLRNVVTSPTSLESTSLVFAYGLDLFFTRVTPSNTFDLLNEDFQWYVSWV